MMNGRKCSFWKILVPVVAIIAVGIVLLLVFSDQTAFALINGPARFLFSADSGFSRSVLFHVMAEEMEDLPQTLAPEIMKEQGVVSVYHGSIDMATDSLFDAFMATASEGKAAQVTFALYTTEGDPIYVNVLFDRVQYFAVVDKTRDSLQAEGEVYRNLRYDYLKIINDPETGNNFVVLTNDSRLTFEQLRIAQIGSDMESIDSFHLFSFSEK